MTDAWLESARAAFARRVAARVSGMIDVAAAETIINAELDRLLHDLRENDLLDLDGLVQTDDDATYLSLAELDRPEQSED